MYVMGYRLWLQDRTTNPGYVRRVGGSTSKELLEWFLHDRYRRTIVYRGPQKGLNLLK